MTARNTRSFDELVAEAKSRYRDKDFGGANNIFQKALKMRPDGDMNVSDYLAATAEKLENFQDAISHGRQMIRLDGSNARGYLRVGRTLENNKSEDQSKTALSIYDLGLKKVKKDDPNLKV